MVAIFIELDFLKLELHRKLEFHKLEFKKGDRLLKISADNDI